MSHQYVVLVSLPGLRSVDLAQMPTLASLAQSGASTPLVPSFPCVTCPSQITLSTGVTADKHGIIGNGIYWREQHQPEFWTFWNEIIEAPRIWDRLHQQNPELTTALWFPLLTKGTTAEYACTFAPIHNPDGSESLWCYTKPTELYGELRDELGHFPLKHFWGPLANIKSSQWIVDSAVIAAKKFAPRFTYIYLPHLDYAAQKFGPHSDQARQAVIELDAELKKLIDGFQQAGLEDTLWMFAGEYAITEVEAVSYPNRILREAGLLKVTDSDEGELIDFENLPAWAMVDHQFAHIYLQNSEQIEQVADLLKTDPLIEQIFIGNERAKMNLDHPRSGEIVILSKPDAWFAYYYWLDDRHAPGFARTVDIHRKPGYDPCEMFIEMPSRQTPLDATLIKGSHGYPADTPERETLFVISDSTKLETERLRDVDIASLVYKNFGL